MIKTGQQEKTSLVRLDLEALIAKESSMHLAKLGDTEKRLAKKGTDLFLPFHFTQKKGTDLFFFLLFQVEKNKSVPFFGYHKPVCDYCGRKYPVSFDIVWMVNPLSEAADHQTDNRIAVLWYPGQAEKA